MSKKTNRTSARAIKAKGKLLPFAFIGPHLIIFIIFALLPTIFGVYVSFTKWDMIGTPRWVGLDNYREILINTDSTFYRQFWSGLKETLIFVGLNLPLSICIPLMLALFLHTRPYGRKIYQSILYMPTLFSIASVGLIWMQLLNRRFGLASVLGAKVPWATHKPEAWVSLMAMSVWWTMGTNMVIYQSALSSVPKELYESASIDGANPFQQFFKITLPSIRFQILYTLVITLAGSFNVYGQPTIMTRVNPSDGPAIQVLVYHIKSIAFGSGQSVAGIASAMAMMLGLMIIVVSFFQFRIIKSENA